jgi:hypothetical protein
MSEQIKNSDIIKILSPLILFVFHIVYLVAFSPDPFLTKWLEGSFTFFLALVLCNILRGRVATSRQVEGPDAGAPGDPGDGEGSHDPT